MTTRKMLTAACALALGVAWTMAPAVAADDTAKDKMERAKDKTENKAEDVKDKTKDKMDTAKDKMGNAVDKTKDKAVEIKDKTKEKAVEVKDKIREKVSGRKNGTTVAKGSDDVRQAQQSLTEKGFNPGPVDGIMGPHTKAALSDYQKKENLKVTGRLDHETKSRLVNASVSKKADTTAPAASPSTTTSTTPDSSAPAVSTAPAPGTTPAPSATPASPSSDSAQPKKQKP